MPGRMDAETKAYLEAMESRMDPKLEALVKLMRDVETTLLTAFRDYATGIDGRVKRLEGADASVTERLAALESRVLRLETRPPR